jgi:hypothetical protein
MPLLNPQADRAAVTMQVGGDGVIPSHPIPSHSISFHLTSSHPT